MLQHLVILIMVCPQLISISLFAISSRLVLIKVYEFSYKLLYNKNLHLQIDCFLITLKENLKAMIEVTVAYSFCNSLIPYWE